MHFRYLAIPNVNACESLRDRRASISVDTIFVVAINLTNLLKRRSLCRLRVTMKSNLSKLYEHIPGVALEFAERMHMRGSENCGRIFGFACKAREIIAQVT